MCVRFVCHVLCDVVWFVCCVCACVCVKCVLFVTVCDGVFCVCFVVAVRVFQDGSERCVGFVVRCCMVCVWCLFFFCVRVFRSRCGCVLCVRFVVWCCICVVGVLFVCVCA